MAKIYFGCSMRGGQPNLPIDEIAKIVNAVKDLGHELMSEHQVKDVNSDKDKHEVFIHERDFERITQADAGIFEITNPSLGVGAEIADMNNLKKPVLCLYKRGFKDRISAYIIGKHGSKHIKTAFECYEYDTIGDAKYAIKKFLKDNIN